MSEEVATRNRGGRPKGSRNKAQRSLCVILDHLEAEKLIQPRAWFLKAQAIALSDSPDRMIALRTLLQYKFGLPLGRVEIEHGLTPSAEEIFRGVAESDRHRQVLEEIERRQLREGSVTVEVVESGEGAS
jgi:hypothetical protein